MRVIYTWLLATFCSMFGLLVFAEGKFEVVRSADIKWGPCDPNTPADPCQIKYFRGNPEKEENYAFIKVPKGHTFPPHWHLQNENLIVTQGTLMIGSEKDSKGTPERAGEYAFVPAKWVHWGACAEQECVFYLNNESADSYIDVKDRRP